MHNFKMAGVFLLALVSGAFLLSCSSDDSTQVSTSSENNTEASRTGSGLAGVAAQLGVDESELMDALGDPDQGPPDFDAAAEILGVSAADLEEAMKSIMDQGESVELDPYTVTINGVDFVTVYDVFTWNELPEDVVYERQPIQVFVDPDGVRRYYEAVYVSSGNLNWTQAAILAEDAGGYLASITSEEENTFVFNLVSDDRYFWHFDEDGDHYGISIGPFLGGYQPEGSQEPAGGWQWLSGEVWDYTNWAVNLDDGVTDKDPRPNDQPNDSGDGQPIMGFGEMNLPVPTWGDYMEAVGTYGLTKSPGSSYGFIIEYESDPR